MEKTETGNQKADSLQRKPDNQPALIHRPRKWPTLLSVGTLIASATGGIWAILWASTAFTDVAIAVNFIVVNILSLLVLLAIVTQACIYWAQRGIMKQQGEVLKEQSSTLKTQTVAMAKQIIAMDGQLTTMQDQAESMKAALIETRNIVSQNERAIKAAEESTAIAKDAFYVGEAPYFGITQITFEWIPNNVEAGTNGGGRPKVKITS